MSMNTKSSPSRYRYCISRLSTLATSTRTPALNVLSTTLPDSTFFSLVRTKAPPLPGLTCWKSTTLHRAPSRLSVMPFFRSFVVATCVYLLRASGTAVPRSEHEQFLGGRGEYLRRSRCRAGSTDHEGVLDPDSALAGQVDPRLDRDRNPVPECTRPARSEHRCFVDLKPHPVAQAMAEIAAMTGRLDQVPRRRVDLAEARAGDRCGHACPLRRRDQVIHLSLPGRRLAQSDSSGHVGVVAVNPRPAVDGDQVP